MTEIPVNWLVTEFSRLMAAAHISLPTPPPNVHLGPGPIDPFSTDFDNLFADHVKATVDGKAVSKAELKQKLLNLKKHWKADHVKFKEEHSSPPNYSAVAVLAPHQTVDLHAETAHEGGKTVIIKFSAKATPPSLFD